MTRQRQAPVPDLLETMNSRHEHLPALPSMLLGQHTAIAALWHAAANHHPTVTDPHRTRELADAFIVTTCRHLAAVNDVVLPAARAPGSRSLIAGYLRGCRELERTLHRLKANTYGDAHACRCHRADLWHKLQMLLDQHESQETALVQGLTRAATAEADTVLVHRMHRSQRHAPTRPHPYSPHTGVAGRLSNRVWAVLDAAWDCAEHRFVPPHTDAPSSRPGPGSPR